MDWRKMRSEDRVSVTLDMVDAVTSIAASNERDRNPNITERTLISRLRRRFQQGRPSHPRR
jgi:hypothetical protein